MSLPSSNKFFAVSDSTEAAIFHPPWRSKDTEQWEAGVILVLAGTIMLFRVLPILPARIRILGFITVLPGTIRTLGLIPVLYQVQ